MHQLRSLSNTRVGFHYFSDTLHFRESDLLAWLPELRALGAAWLTIQAPEERAIPEFFLRGLLEAGIEPILHFHLPLDGSTRDRSLQLLFESYARWGAQYVSLFDRPNQRSSWPAMSWTQADLVERFLDLFLPVAVAALEAGLTPVFPPLEPGGDYWDTAFLRAALRGLQRRGHSRLLDKLILGAYAWTGNRPLNWGAGGPERWPGARPYFTPAGVQDQVGFRIFDWYLTLARAELGQSRPILLLKAGCLPNDRAGTQASAGTQADSLAWHTQANLALARLMAGEAGISAGQADQLEAVPAEVLACNFWLLAAAPESPYTSQAWFHPSGSSLPAVNAFHQWAEARQIQTRTNQVHRYPGAAHTRTGPLIAHYLLLPIYGWGVPDWHLDGLRPFIKEFHPTIGFSLVEAANAGRVTVVGGEQAYPEEALQTLRNAGCTVERMIGDGTLIAT